MAEVEEVEEEAGFVFWSSEKELVVVLTESAYEEVMEGHVMKRKNRPCVRPG